MSWYLTTAGGPVCGRKEDQGQWSEGDTLRDVDGTPEEKCQWPEILCVAEAQGGLLGLSSWSCFHPVAMAMGKY